MVLIKLLESEKGKFLSDLPPTTLASFYHIDEKTYQESTNITEHLKLRAAEILKANPWLCGRLIKEETDTKEICLSYNEEVTNHLTYVHQITSDKIFAQKDWKNIATIISMYTPKVGSLCIDKDEQLCAFLIIQNTTSTELALVLSINHNIADGYTIYYLWKMLDENETIHQMDVERDLKFTDYVKRDTNLHGIFDSTTNVLKMFAGIMCRGIGRLIRQKSSPRMDMYTVNSEVVKRIKEENSLEDSFVSTNDVLNCWFFGSEVCNADNILMAINMRERLPEIQANMAGNYQFEIILRTADMDNPKTFRQKWKDVMSKKRLPSAMPSFTDAVSHSWINLTSNWATFFHQIDLVGYHHAFHIPVLEPSKLVSRFVGIPLSSECFILIFKVNRDEYGILYVIYNDLVDDYFDNCEMLNERFLSQK